MTRTKQRAKRGSRGGTARGVLALACTVALSCGRGGPEVERGGEFSDASWSDVVLEPSARPAWRSLRQVPEGAAQGTGATTPEGTTPATVDPRAGEIDVLIGTAGDGRALPEAAVDRFDGGFGGSYVLAGERPPPRLHVVLDAPYQSWADEGTFVHVLALTPDFRPADGAEVYLDGHLVGTADAHGAIAFRRHPVPGQEGGQGTLVVRHGGLSRRLRYHGGSRTSSFEATTVYAYTDRGIYEPGDTALFRAVAWRLRGEYVPLAAHELEIELVDDRERIVSGAVVETDDWGIGELPLPIPSTLADGPYRLRVRSGEEVAESRLIVQRFVPPVIAIDHDLPRYLAITRDELTAHVSLRYFAGSPFEEGHLALIAKLDGRELARVESDVRGQGPHALSFDAATLARILTEVRGGPSGRALVRRTLELDLVASDPSLRSDTIHRFVDVVENPYIVVVELDRTRYQAGDPVNVMVRATERDGVPVRARVVELRIGAGRRMTATSDEAGVARFTFPMLASAAPLDAFLDDVEEPVGHAELPSPVSIPMLSSVPATVVRSGDDIEVRVLFPSDVTPVEEVVHADVVDSSGAIIHSAVVPIVGSGAAREARGVMRAPSWGSMLLTLWCVGRRGNTIGVVTDGQSLVVTPGETLTVTLGGLPEGAGPGDEVDATIEVRDASGALHEAMLGVSVVDRAVVSLLDPFERAPADRFYNPERKVLASTGAQTLTWPWVSRTWGSDRVDIGWPATFGFHGGSDPRARTVAPADAASFDALEAEGSIFGSFWGNALGTDFGFAGLGLTGTGMGGGGTGEGTIGLGNLGTIGHGAGTGSGQGYGAGAGRLRGRGDDAHESEPGPAANPTTIVLRTSFDETSVWLPRLVAEDGRASFHARLPESITEQQINVLATDRTGGVTLARLALPVSQPLFVRSDLPPSLGELEQVEVGVAVENHGATAERVTLALEALDGARLAIEGETRTVEVAPGGTAAARFTLVGTRAGPARYRVHANAGAFEDVEERELFVEPDGEPMREGLDGLARAGAPFRTTIELPEEDRMYEVRLGVVFPTVAPAIAGLESLFQGGSWGPDPASSQVMGAAALYRYLVLTERFEPARDAQLLERLRRISSELTRAQQPDGGFGWFWSEGRSAPFITVHALEAMLELRDVGLFQDEQAIARARAYLVAELREHGRLRTRDIAPWEGESPRIRDAATAEALHAIARAAASDDPDGAALASEVLEPLSRELLAAPTVDPLALAHIVAAGLWAGTLDRAALEGAVLRLSELREVSHWEPGWFDAWGGNVEAAATILEVLEAIRASDAAPAQGLVTDARFEAAARDAIRFILHTRRSFGAWHNTRATAWAIRALTRVAPGDPDDHGTVRVFVDGEEHSAVEVSATGMFASALALREVDLSHLAPGSHQIEVRYDGTSQPRVELEVRHWVGMGRGAGEGTVVQGASSAPIERRTEERCSVGGACSATVSLPAELRFPALVEQPLGDTLEADRVALEALRARGAIAWYEVQGGVLRVALAARAEELELPLRPTRRGELVVGETRLSSLAGGAIRRTASSRVQVP